MSLFLVACSNKSTGQSINNQPIKESTYVPTEIENVSISIYDVSSIGATIVIEDTNETPFLYGAWYKLEQKKNGEWYEINARFDNYGFDMMGYVPDEKGKLEFNTNWQWLYGELPIGEYRILKQVGTEYISVEFLIEESTVSEITIAPTASLIHRDEVEDIVCPSCGTAISVKTIICSNCWKVIK
jgi:hypothetical protein